MESTGMAVKTMVFYLMILTICSNGQNLVQNGDFEEYYSCPKVPGDFEFCKNWYLANYSTPDYFRRCQDGSAALNVPYNHAGNQEPRSGDAYAGFFLISAENPTYREYIQGELTSELRKDSKYMIRLHLSWADYSSIFCDRIGFAFSSERLNPKRKDEWNFTPLSKSAGFSKLKLDLLKNRQEWHLVEYEYTAKGKERFLIIGVFKDNLSEKDLNVFLGREYKDQYARKKAAYFYIDDVSVRR